MIYCTFSLDQTQFALCALNIREIIPANQITPVPLSDSSVKGLINVRGQVVPVLDLRARLGLKPNPAQKDTRSILITKADQELMSRACSKDDLQWMGPSETSGIDIDVIGDLIEYDSPLDPAPVHLSSINPRFVSGLLHTKDELILVLDLKELLSLSTTAENTGEQ